MPLLLAKEVNFYHKQRGVMETIFPPLGVSVENFVCFFFLIFIGVDLNVLVSEVQQREPVIHMSTLF